MTDLRSTNTMRTSDAELEARQAQHWKLTQWFRKMEEDTDHSMEPENFDHISTLEFDDTGRFLATGDHSGNVVILENDGPGRNGAPAHFSFFHEFQSHFRDFNFVSSEPIEPKINDIKFGPMTDDFLLILAASDKEIKLWKVKEEEQYTLTDFNTQRPQYFDQDGQLLTPEEVGLRGRLGSVVSPVVPHIKKLRIPRKQLLGRAKMANLRKAYSQKMHNFDVASLCITSDKMNFLSADNLRINLWDFYRDGECYNIVDIKPEDLQDLSEIITSVDAHPSDSNTLIYSTSVGNILTCDLRVNALADEPVAGFCQPPPENEMLNGLSEEQNDIALFLEEMSNNISKVKYSRGGKYIFSRDYMSVKLWDTAMQRAPVETIYVHEYLRDKMSDLYGGELFLDSFGMGLSSQGNVVTGSYSNYFHIMDFGQKRDYFLQAGNPTPKECSLHGLRNKKVVDPNKPSESHAGQRKMRFPGYSFFGGKKRRPKRGSIVPEERDEDVYPHNLPFEKLDFSKKLLSAAWHPLTDTVAVSGQNNVYIYGRSS